MKLKKNKVLRITCDGGAATGKSTGAKLIANKFGLSFLSSGLLYRYASYMIIKKNPKNIINFLKKEFIKLNYKKLNNINLHLPKISEHSAIIAKIPAVRSILKKYFFSRIFRQTHVANKKKSECQEPRDSVHSGF